jgi:hypothetical protein
VEVDELVVVGPVLPTVASVTLPLLLDVTIDIVALELPWPPPAPEVVPPVVVVILDPHPAKRASPLTAAANASAEALRVKEFRFMGSSGHRGL